jgi:Flp pilus assembly protein TadG
LLIVLSGLVEFGFMLNEYLALQDAARNAARFASDGLYYAQRWRL